jgi:hypothetical protein
LLYLAGERPQALLAFDRCEQLLKDEVGVSPSPETLALLQTIVRAESARRPEAPAQAEALVPAACCDRRSGSAALTRGTCWPRRAAKAQLAPASSSASPAMGKSRLLADLVLATNATTPARRAGDGAARRRTGALRAGGAVCCEAVLAGYPVEPGCRAAHAAGAHRSRARPEARRRARPARAPD